MLNLSTLNSKLDDVAKGSLKIISELLAQDQMPCGDCKELAMLLQFYLDPEIFGLTSKRPGACHHARFIAPLPNGQFDISSVVKLYPIELL